MNDKPPTNVWFITRFLFFIAFSIQKKVRAKWPKRVVRELVVYKIDRRCKDGRDLSERIRQHGYTNGDRIVVMLESDFQRVADLAHKKQTDDLSSVISRLAMFNLPHLPSVPKGAVEK